MGIVGPNLSFRLKGILRDADDHSCFPVRKPAKITRVGHYDGNLVELTAPKNVNALMLMSGSKRVTPKITDESIGWYDERRIPASFTSGYGPLRMVVWIPQPG